MTLLARPARTGGPRVLGPERPPHPVNVGCLQIVLHVPDAQSLKDKRRIVRGLLDRVRDRFQVAAAEVDDQDAWQSAVVGFSCVSSDARHAASVMEKVLAFVRETPAARVIEHELETL